MSPEESKRLYGRRLSELWNGDLSVADGTRVTMHGHDLLRVRSGRFAEYWALSEQPTPEEAA